MEPKLGITAAHLESVAHILNPVLADEFLLYVKTRRAHWNVTGRDFHPKHIFFESQYKQLDEIVDDLAERIRALGHFPPSTLKSMLELSHFTEAPGEGTDGLQLVEELLNDHQSLIISLREIINVTADKYKDMGTSDFLTGLLRTHEQMAWMLRAHLQ